MALSINRVILKGRVGQDPEVRTLSSGGCVANLSLATSSRWFDKKANEWKESPTSWHSLSAWNNLGERVGRTVSKGDLLFVEGTIEYQEYEDKDGNKRHKTQIKVFDFHKVLVEKSNSQNRREEDEAAGKPVRSQKPQPTEIDDMDMEMDDDIPY